jgi:spore coat protein CotF
MTEQEILQDALIGTKFLLSMYNQFGLECSNPELRNLFNEQRSMVSENNFKVFEVMKKKKLYPITKATITDVDKALQMHSQMQSDLDKAIKIKK